MSEKVWYYLRNGEQHGPVGIEDLQALMQSDSLAESDLVWKEGMDGWEPAGQVEELAPQRGIPEPPPVAAPPGPQAQAAPPRASGPGLLGRIETLGDQEGLVQQMPHLRLIQKLLDKLQGCFSAKLLDGVDRWAKGIGSVALLLAAAFLMLSYLVTAIAHGEMIELMGGGRAQYVLIALVAIPLGILLMHFMASKFLDAGRSLLSESPSAFSSTAFLHCYALGNLLLGGVAILGGLLSLISGSFVQAIGLLAAAPVLFYVCGVALNPALINVRVGHRASAGEEAIGILAFLYKLPLRLVPFVFGVGMVAAFLGSLYVAIRLMADSSWLMLLQPLTMVLVVLALFPIIAYLLFLLLYLVVDVLRAILAIPAKLDALRKDSE